MAETEPVGEIDARYSGADALATDWARARGALREAEIFWLTTVRPDGRPHVTPLLAVWQDGALHFCTGEAERKAKNLRSNRHCVLTTGCNALDEGLDLVVEGDAVQVRDEAALNLLADAYEAKYGSDWRFTVRDGAFSNDEGPVPVFRVAPDTVFAFSKGQFSQTRLRFERD
jgi:nitroimidazol reductase NimA-like FMN-containing flavoprotein (pyridoxamine 5'-phosphate oxidase superfamily)